MKYAIVIPDGCADEPQESLGGKTPLQAANTPNMDAAAAQGIVGLSNNVPSSLIPASDVATLSLLGYDPLKYYTGRAPLEAAALGIQLGPNDWAIRCNLVTVENGEMRDFTAGHIAPEDGSHLVDSLREILGTTELEFHTGVSYRNLLIYRGSGDGPFARETKTQAPHDVPDQPIAAHAPRGPGSKLLCTLMEKSREIFASHPVNRARVENGKRPATQIWLWGQGQAPQLPTFEERFNRRGAIISAVDLVRGVCALLGWTRIDAPGATGYLDTDYASKGRTALATLKDFDITCIHIEAPDEASHEGKTGEKVKALEEIDKHIVGPILNSLPDFGNWRILISPDHRTTLRTRAHAHGAVPFVMAGSGIEPQGPPGYYELSPIESPLTFEDGCNLMPNFLG